MHKLTTGDDHRDQKSEVVIVAGSDNRYAMPLTVSLHSALSTTARDRSVRIFIIESGIERQNIARIRSCLSKAHPNVTLEVFSADKSRFSELATIGHISGAMYLRLLIPEYLPKDVGTVLYVDSDVLVTEDVSPLFDLDLGGTAVWAVRANSDDDLLAERLERLRLDCPSEQIIDGGSYFNSGVLLINLPEWRSQKISEQAFEVIKQYGSILKAPDQDALNIVCNSKWGSLPTKWNNQIFSDRNSPRGKQLFPELADKLGGEGIIHFSGPIKPWSPGARILKQDAYFCAMKNSNYYSFIEYAGFHIHRAYLRPLYITTRSIYKLIRTKLVGGTRKNNANTRALRWSPKSGKSAKFSADELKDG